MAEALNDLIVGALAAFIYAGGFLYTAERRGIIRGLVWPFALGIALARFTEREMLIR